MKLTEEELTREIRDCAKYLREKAVLDVRLGLVRPTHEDIEAAGLRDAGLYDYASLVDEIRSISEKLGPIIERLNRLSEHFAHSRLELYSDIEDEIEGAREHAAGAKVRVDVAINRLEGTRPPNSKAMPLQKSAVRLAHAILGASQQRRVRAIAKRIIMEAELDTPSETVLTEWIKEVRADDK
ncbi:hypothetical protein WIT60_05755 [Aquabacterium sp. G14]|uniref:hypothetical protein n=1 Tax=Aquabacterium sp. G14 TaxID=3130164 RepID=UPI0030A4CBDF